MANYIIIGGDGKEYGPISGDDLRKWIAEGRLNAQSLAKSESDAEFRPLSVFPEFADAFTSHVATAGVPPTFSTADFSERDYELDIGGCVSRGWNLFKNNFGTLFVGVLIYALIEGAIGLFARIPFIGPLFSIANLFIAGPLIGGIFYVFIQTIRNRPASAGDVFAGFRKGFWQLFLGYLIPALIVLACMIPFFIFYFIKIFPALANLQHHTQDSSAILAVVKSALAGSLPILLISMLPIIYLSLNWQFTLPLIIDKQMDFWTAMKTSWKMVHKHWWHMFGLFVVIGLLNIAGLCACCIGALFTAPIGFAAMMYAYETIFSESQAS
ncbi:MAG TPA: glycerophosphoryl diester phosphodiesterase membrane domain-containing protein [Methylomirabilota bacterium]|nr:glycerophosphoryl diester phosphodiesterase membrane domain-containing protein [Methylomirabilota bacterium]